MNAELGSRLVFSGTGMTAGYGGVSAIRDVSIEATAGEITALLGANGAGKSTTLLTLVGELPLIEGRRNLGEAVIRAPLHRLAQLGVAYVPEERAIFRGLTCGDNLRVGLADPEVALSVFPELKPLLKTPAGLLSGGEQQMLSLGRALSFQPKFLLIDELSLGLAPLVVQRLFDELTLAAGRGVGVLLVEQHVRKALTICDRVYIMRRGQIAMSGSAQSVGDRIEEIEGMYLSSRASGE